MFEKPWINDLDEGVYDLWRLVKENPDYLIGLIEEHSQTLQHNRDPKKIRAAIALWKQVKSDTNHKLFSPGYRFLFLSKTCYSGVVTGGPTGGMAQNGNYNITSRWSQKNTIKRIQEIHPRMQDCKITNLPWEKVVSENGSDVAMYLDPPYLEKGSQCYRLFFTLEDHKSLAQSVVDSGHRYVVSVDDNPAIRQIWSDLRVPEERIIPDSWFYSMSGGMGKELFIVDERSAEIVRSKEPAI